jgi:molybdopterin converting factor small subunit
MIRPPTNGGGVQVQVRLSAPLAQMAGSARLVVDLGDGATVGDLRKRLTTEQPVLSPGLARALAVVRGAHAGADQVLAHGDEVALLLPAAGG